MAHACNHFYHTRVQLPQHCPQDYADKNETTRNKTNRMDYSHTHQNFVHDQSRLPTSGWRVFALNSAMTVYFSNPALG